MTNRRVYQLISAILLGFSISILLGQFSPVRAQLNQSDQFFQEGEQEFNQEAENLEKQQEPNSQPLLTIDEEPPLTINEENEESNVVEDVPSPDRELRINDNMPEQPANEEIKIKF